MRKFNGRDSRVVCPQTLRLTENVFPIGIRSQLAEGEAVNAHLDDCVATCRTEAVPAYSGVATTLLHESLGQVELDLAVKHAQLLAIRIFSCQVGGECGKRL